MIGEQLEQDGYEVLLASDGDEAFDVLQSAPRVDLIVTDVRMPGALDGFDLVERALVTYPGLRAIVMSGYSDGPGTRSDSAARFLQKPFTMRFLAKEVQSVLAA